MSHSYLVRRICTLLLGAGLALLGSAELQAQQTGTVRGRVTAAGTMQPLGGAQVFVVGSGRGSLTNASGDFLIVGVPTGTQSVRVQMLGYGTATQQVTVTEGQTASINFELQNQAIALDEVVVTGAGVVTQKKSLGQSVSTVNAEEFRQAPVANVTDALSGRVPGLVANAAGETGQGAPIRLRGTVSLSQRNGPLIYVDGVRVDNRLESWAGNSAVATNRLNDLNPNNIERVEVLKGAAAATLYGTEASAGVIQIFTKRGLDGAPQWEFNTTQQMLVMPDRIPDNVVFNRTTGELMRNNPADDFVRNGHHQQYYLSVRGGSESAKYFASGWFKDETGIFPSNALGNTGVNVGLDVTPFPKLQTQFNLEIIQNELQVPYPTWGLVGEFVLADPSRVRDGRPYGELFHSVAGALAYRNTESANRYTISGTGRYQWADGLRSQLTLGYNTIDLQGLTFVEFGADPRDPGGRRDLSDTRRENITLDLSTAWEEQFGKLNSQFTVGAQSFWENSSRNRVRVIDYPSSGLETLRGGRVDLVEEDYTEVINAGIFAQEQLGINDRLFLTAGVRIDGNSAFGDDFGFQTYPKAGVSWNVHEEPFFNVGFFDQLRLRAAYGTSGLQPGAYDALRTWRAYQALENIAVIRPYAVGNEDLKPERSTEIEFGVDLAFLENRVGIEATYFRQRTDDAILRRQLPPSLGFDEPQVVNIGELQSNGAEATLDVLAYEGRAMRLQVGASLSLIDQTVTSMGGVSRIKTSGDTRRWNHIAEGYQPGAVLAPKLNPDNPYRTTVPIERLTTLSQVVPITIKNAAGADSLIFQGNQLPTTTGTVSFNFDFPVQNLSLRTMFRGEGGHVVLDQTNLIRTQVFITEETAEMNRILANPASTAEDRRAVAERYAQMHPAVHANWLRDAQNVRLQEAALTWRLPETLASRLRLENSSVTLAGRNLFIWTGYDGIGDPGATSTPTADFNQNVDYFAAPSPRRFELSFRTSF